MEHRYQRVLRLTAQRPTNQQGEKLNADKIRSRMQKLLALARRGEGGEKENAQRFLDKMLAQHGMTLADLDDEGEQKQFVDFKYSGELERRLLVQIVCTVLNTSKVNVAYARSKMGLDVTRAQRLEIDLFFASLRKELAKNVDRMFLAFIVKNGITGPSESSDDDEPSKLTREDIEAIRNMMEGINKTDVRRAIEHRPA